MPLESNPHVFTVFVHRLGVSAELVFHHVLSLEDPDLMALVPRPALALVLVFPTSAPYAGKGESGVCISRPINNACGLYAILRREQRRGEGLCP